MQFIEEMDDDNDDDRKCLLFFRHTLFKVRTYLSEVPQKLQLIVNKFKWRAKHRKFESRCNSVFVQLMLSLQNDIFRTTKLE